MITSEIIALEKSYRIVVVVVESFHYCIAVLN